VVDTSVRLILCDMMAHKLFRKSAAHSQNRGIFTIAERAALHGAGVVLKNAFACGADRYPDMSDDSREALRLEQRRTLLLCMEAVIGQGLQTIGLAMNTPGIEQQRLLTSHVRHQQ